jgi:hypothetical protein
MAFRAATEEMSSFKIDLSKAVNRTIAALYATIYEETEAGIVLYEAKKYTGAQLILRPLLEAHVDLVALIRDPSYIEHMAASHDKELHRLLKHGFAGANPFLKPYWNNANVKMELEALEQRLKERKDRNIAALRVDERFALADMTEEYQSAYNDLCCQSHNNLRALMQRHVEIDEEKKELNLVVNMKPDDSTIGALLDGLLGSILSSSIYVHRHFDSPALKRFEELDQRRTVYLKAL